MTVNHGFHATMTARPGKADELIELLLDAPSLPREDCVVFLVGRSASNPDVVHVTEGWTSPEAHAEFFASEPAQALVAALAPLLAGESQYADEVPVGGKAAF
ncbi:antibiotic biosynthesis monooxygenase family protein [Micromonospora costi]|uniref:putative quinol monooxygenase n=1 Tax=Micromonospora costi TaxID=1530042 RepID=UPI0033DE3348